VKYLPFENNYFTEMCDGYKVGSYSRPADFCVSLKSRLGSNEEEEQHEEVKYPSQQ
jgi:hypothetical protein